MEIEKIRGPVLTNSVYNVDQVVIRASRDRVGVLRSSDEIPLSPANSSFTPEQIKILNDARSASDKIVVASFVGDAMSGFMLGSVNEHSLIVENIVINPERQGRAQRVFALVSGTVDELRDNDDIQDIVLPVALAHENFFDTVLDNIEHIKSRLEIRAQEAQIPIWIYTIKK